MYALGAPFVVLVWPQTCKNFSLSCEASPEFPARTKTFWRETSPARGQVQTHRPADPTSEVRERLLISLWQHIVRLISTLNKAVNL